MRGTNHSTLPHLSITATPTPSSKSSHITFAAMEGPMRIFTRQLLTRSTTATRTNFLKHSPIFCRTTNRQHILSTPTLSFCRVHPSLSSVSHSPITPNSNPFDFILSLYSSNLSLNPSFPTNNTDFNFKSHSKDSFFDWNRAPGNAVNGNVGVLGAKDPVTTVVLLGWLGAKRKHLKKYVEWYNSRGIHAITFVVDVKEVLWFDLGKTVEKRLIELANKLISWVSEREEDGRERCLVFHTFSNTGFLGYGYIMEIFRGREGLMEKIKGCVVDSGGGDLLIPKVWAAGFLAALLKKHSSVIHPAVEAKHLNELGSQANGSNMQEKEAPLIEATVLSVLEKIFSVILKFPDVDRKLKKIVTTLSKNHSCPQLYLYSTNDKVVPFQSIESMIENQKMMGRKVLSCNFRLSPHVDHYRTFPDVYSSVLHNFLRECFATVKHT